MALAHTERIADAVTDAGRLSPEVREWAEALHRESFASRDFEEGKAAFAEDREPDFPGR